MFDRVLRSRTIVTPEGILDGAVAIKDSKIAAILRAGELPSDFEDLGDAALLPGLVDSHAHLNEPGRTEWEGYDTATHAAAAGGVTTIVDMPLNCIPVTTSLAAFEAKRAAVAAHAHIDYGFWGGVVPGNTSELERLLDAGILGAKAFLCHSGIDDFPASTEADLRQAMPVLARAGRPLLLHAELEAPLVSGVVLGNERHYATFLASRPPSWEVEAIALAARLCAEFHGPVHIVHLSAADALVEVERARAAGLPFSAETCPHYLSLVAEEIPDGRTEYKCAPPIRERENRARLWEGLRLGTLSMVVSDHSPCTPALKKPEVGDFMDAWGGIASLQLALPLLWTGAKPRGFGLGELARWMAAAPAALAGLSAKKGSIKVGLDADLVVFDPHVSTVVLPEMLHFRHKLTPYMNRRLDGAIRQTVLRGVTVYDGASFPVSARGRLLTP